MKRGAPDNWFGKAIPFSVDFVQRFPDAESFLSHDLSIRVRAEDVKKCVRDTESIYTYTYNSDNLEICLQCSRLSGNKQQLAVTPEIHIYILHFFVKSIYTRMLTNRELYRFPARKCHACAFVSRVIYYRAYFNFIALH